MDTHSPNTITEKKQKGKKMNYGKPNKEKFNEATKLIKKNTGSKEEKMTKMSTYSLHEQLKAHIEDPQGWNYIFPRLANFTLEEYEEMMEYISQGWLIQSDSYLDNNGFIVNPEWDGEPLWEPEEEEEETELKWIPGKGLMSVGIHYKKEEEEEQLPNSYQMEEKAKEDFNMALAFAYGIESGYNIATNGNDCGEAICDFWNALHSYGSLVKDKWRVKVFTYFYDDYVIFNGEILEEEEFEHQYPKMVDEEGNKIIQLETGEYITQKKKIKLNVVKK